MASDGATVERILQRLGSKRFSAQPMMGEYVVYADGKVVAIVADDKLFVKIHPATEAFAASCQQASAYPGSKPYYLVEERHWGEIPQLPKLLLQMADELPEPAAPGAQAGTGGAKASSAKPAGKAKGGKGKRA